MPERSLASYPVIEMFPRALVAPEVTFSTIVVRLSAEKPGTVIAPRAEVEPEVTFSTIVESCEASYPSTLISSRAPVAPEVMPSITAERSLTETPLTSPRALVAPEVIFSTAPLRSDAPSPPSSRLPTIVPTRELEAEATSEALSPASSSCPTEVWATLEITVSNGDDPASAEEAGSLSLRPFRDWVMLKTTTWTTLIVSEALSPISLRLPWPPSTIFGKSAIRSSDSPSPPLLTAWAAASATAWTWASVRLMLTGGADLDAVRLARELLRFDCNSPITEEARVLEASSSFSVSCSAWTSVLRPSVISMPEKSSRWQEASSTRSRIKGR